MIDLVAVQVANIVYQSMSRSITCERTTQQCYRDCAVQTATGATACEKLLIDK